MDSNPRVIAFCGPKGCGKDSAANALLKLNTSTQEYFIRAPFAAGVKGICADFFGWAPTEMDDMEFKETPRPLWEGGPEMAPRWPMMDIANWLRDKYGHDIHAQRWERNVRVTDKPGICHVVTDLRFPNELDYLQKLDALVVYVERPEAEEKLAAAKNSGDAMALNPSEAHYAELRAYAKKHGHVLHNDDSMHILAARTQNIVKSELGYWGYWLKEDLKALEEVQ